jgi:hypothetical protein
MKRILLISNVGPKSMNRPEPMKRPEHRNRPKSMKRPEHRNRPKSMNRPEHRNRPEHKNRPKNMLSVRSLFKSPMLLLLQ